MKKRKLAAANLGRELVYLYLNLLVSLLLLLLPSIAFFIDCHPMTSASPAALDYNTGELSYGHHHHHRHRHNHRSAAHNYQHLDPSAGRKHTWHAHQQQRRFGGVHKEPEVARQRQRRARTVQEVVRAAGSGDYAAAQVRVRNRKWAGPPVTSRREALDLVVNRLHILESLDEQLRAFAEAAGAAQVQVHEGSNQSAVGQPIKEETRRHLEMADQIYCQLSLALIRQNRKSTTGEPEVRRQQDEWCLSDKLLLSQVPPYMLNLYRQLLYELHDLHETVARTNDSEIVQEAGKQQGTLTMPYGAQVMRSFRQPKIVFGGSKLESDYHSTRTRRRRRRRFERVQEGDDDDAIQEEEEEESREVAERANLVVELTLGAHFKESDLSGHAPASSEWAWPEENHSQQTSSPACPFEQRLLPAQQRHEICFWFDLSQNFSPTTNSQLPATSSTSNHTFEFRSRGLRGSARPEVERRRKRGPRERLIEAELHVFKLFPRRNLHNLMENNNNNNNTTSVYHLKTNLLEVSLYQILPRRKTTTTTQVGSANNNGGEFPLRLLDIRRIDLNANGWETFYVKRAVADWLRDARVNLGLVIKAKSMFDEPLQVGQIIFADAYDHHHRAEKTTATRRSTGNLTSTQNFDISHQPLLVIYTQEEQLDT